MVEENSKKHEAAARLYVESRNKIADFGALMEREPLALTDIADVGRLPHPKDDLVAAFRLVLLLTKDQSQRNQLHAGALCLAHYQPDVGPSVLKQMHLPSPDALQRMTPEELAASVLEGSANTGKWKQFNELVDRDIARIASAMGAGGRA